MSAPSLQGARIARAGAISGMAGLRRRCAPRNDGVWEQDY